MLVRSRELELIDGIGLVVECDGLHFLTCLPCLTALAVWSVVRRRYHYGWPYVTRTNYCARDLPAQYANQARSIVSQAAAELDAVPPKREAVTG